MRLAPTSRLILLLSTLGLGPMLLVPFSGRWLLVGLALDACLLTLWVLEGVWMRWSDTLRVSRVVTAQAPLGRGVAVQIRLENRGAWTLHVRVRDSYPEAFRVSTPELEARVPPQGVVQLEYQVVPTSRGDHRFGNIALWIEGGLRLSVRRRWVEQQAPVQVFPDLHVVKEFDALTRRHRLRQMGIRQMRILGSGREFDRLREYLPDDEYRHINWKATARRARPIVNVFQVERGQDILLVLDTSHMMGLAAEGRTKLDACVEAALVLARAALHFEDNVGLVLFASQVERFLPPRRGKNQIGRIVRMLYAAPVQPTAVSFRQTFEFIRSRCRKRALVVFFTDLLDEEQARELLRYLPILRRSHLPLFVTVADQGVADLAHRVPTSEQEVYQTVVAEETQAERQNLTRALEKQGALVVDVPAGELSLATVNTYLGVKATQLL